MYSGTSAAYGCEDSLGLPRDRGGHRLSGFVSQEKKMARGVIGKYFRDDQTRSPRCFVAPDDPQYRGDEKSLSFFFIVLSHPLAVLRIGKPCHLRLEVVSYYAPLAVFRELGIRGPCLELRVCTVHLLSRLLQNSH